MRENIWKILAMINIKRIRFNMGKDTVKKTMKILCFIFVGKQSYYLLKMPNFIKKIMNILI